MANKLETFGREPSFEGAATQGGRVQETVNWVSRGAHYLIGTLSLVVKVMTVAVLLCVAMDFFGIHSAPLLDLFMAAGRLLMGPLGTVFSASREAHGLFDWSGMVALAVLIGAELGLRYWERRLPG